VFADGKYCFRVIASDGGANPRTAREATLISSPGLEVDNHADCRGGGHVHAE